MEENNRKGPGVFYAVVGVATLVVAIIGATFAYFSASAEPAAGTNPTGQTVNVSATNLAITVDRIAFTNATVTNKNLAPALIGTGIANPAALSETNIKAMLNAKCEEANKYTGCHVWKITAINNGQDAIAHANILLDLSVTTAEGENNKDQWGYAVFKATGDVEAASVTAVTYAEVPTGKANHAALNVDVEDLDIHNDAILNTGAGNAAVYYLMVYLNDNKAVQNDGITNGTTNAIGSYNGSVSLEAMSGQVRASFSAGE